MKVIENKQLDILSNLGEDLKEIENRGEIDNKSDLNEAREAVVAAIRGVRESLYQFAESLDCYRTFFRSEGTWRSVLDRIAQAQGCSSRILDRLFSSYTTVKSRLPQIVINAMIELRIEPTAGKNRAVTKAVEQASEPTTREEAIAAVKVANEKFIEMKRTARVEAALVEPGSVEDFAQRIVCMFESHYRTYSASDRDKELQYVLEKIVNNLRSNVRELRSYSRASQVPKPAAMKGRI